MISSVVRSANLDSSLCSVDAFKRLSGSSPERPDSPLASENQAWQGSREREWQRHSRDRGRRQTPVCSHEREAGLTGRAQATPQAPVSKFTLNLFGGHRGLLENSPTVCRHTLHVTADITGQNGRTANQKPILSTPCRKKSKSSKRRGHRAAREHHNKWAHQ